MKQERKVREAASRMRSLGIFEDIIKDFEENGSVQYSEAPLGASYWLPDNIKAVVSDFETEHQAVVYNAIKTRTPIGTMWAFLFVSNYPEEWQSDRDDIKHNEAYAYVYNESDPEMSEIGLIGFKLNAGGTLTRAW